MPALQLVRDYDVIAHKRLNIAGMVRVPEPKPAPGWSEHVGCHTNQLRA
jgi:hypothetical protein